MLTAPVNFPKPSHGLLGQASAQQRTHMYKHVPASTASSVSGIDALSWVR